MDQVVETIRQFGDYLGDEIAVSVSMDEKGEPGEPLVLAELKNSAGFRAVHRTADREVFRRSERRNRSSSLSRIR